MNDKNRKIIENGCIIEGASEYFFKHLKDFPTYKHIKDDYMKRIYNKNGCKI